MCWDQVVNKIMSASLELLSTGGPVERQWPRNKWSCASSYSSYHSSLQMESPYHALLWLSWGRVEFSPDPHVPKHWWTIALSKLPRTRKPLSTWFSASLLLCLPAEFNLQSANSRPASLSVFQALWPTWLPRGLIQCVHLHTSIPSLLFLPGWDEVQASACFLPEPTLK